MIVREMRLNIRVAYLIRNISKNIVRVSVILGAIFTGLIASIACSHFRI